MEYLLVGESYAGHYIPAFSNALLDDSDLKSGFTASLVGNPFVTAIDQKRMMYIVPEALNIIDDSNMPQIAALRKTCTESLIGDYSNSYDYCSNIMTYIEQVSGGAYAYDLREFDYDYNAIEKPIDDYFMN